MILPGVHFSLDNFFEASCRSRGKPPKLSDAMRRGAVSYSKVRAVTRVATPETEQALLDVAQSGTAAHVEQIVRGWRRVDRTAERTEEKRRQDRRSLRTWVDEDGMVVVQGRLTPEVGAALRRALEAACDKARPAAVDAGNADSEASDVAMVEEQLAPTFAQLQADAMGMVAECALGGGLDRGTAGDHYQVVVHVDARALADARDVPAGTHKRAALAPVTERLDQEGIEIEEQAAPPAWKGERVDIGWAVGLLWRPRQEAPSAHTHS